MNFAIARAPKHGTDEPFGIRQLVFNTMISLLLNVYSVKEAVGADVAMSISRSIGETDRSAFRCLGAHRMKTE